MSYPFQKFEEALHIEDRLGYDELGAVSFSKGCYPGQEIVARARYLGKVKRGPLSLRLAEDPGIAAGERVDLLRDGEWSPGTLIDGSVLSDGTARLFVVAAREPDAPATVLRHGGRDYGSATT